MNFGINLLLALLWASIIGPFTPANFAVGFLVGYTVLLLCSGNGQIPRYSRQVVASIQLTVFTIVELVNANVRVAWYTVSRLSSLQPAVLRVPLTGRSEG